MPAGDAVLAGCAAMSGACALVDVARRRLVTSLDALIARDLRDTPQPTRSVLVLDDSDAARVATVYVLRTLGVPLITASTSAEARVAIRRDRPAVIVADYHLDGETCLALLRERPAYCRAVIVTGRVDLDVLAPLARAVSADLVGRPIDDEGEHALLSLVRSHLPTETP
jgi:CheY-like chemotaxis protein